MLTFIVMALEMLNYTINKPGMKILPHIFVIIILILSVVKMQGNN